MTITTTPYLQQNQVWPQSGQHILAQYDAESVIVYQAYRPEIGSYAIEHGRLDGPAFSLTRMSWIKPNFLWMMYRSGWGTKAGQEVTLGLRLRRAFFDELVVAAVPSSFEGAQMPDRERWQEAIATSEVRLQWDPDHAPDGAKLARRAIQIGVRGQLLRRMAHEELLEVVDMTGFVARQRPLADAGQLDGLLTPAETVYLPLRA